MENLKKSSQNSTEKKEDKQEDKLRQQTALNILKTKGETDFIKHVFTDDKTGRKLDYSEMRSRYG